MTLLSLFIATNRAVRIGRSSTSYVPGAPRFVVILLSRPVLLSTSLPVIGPPESESTGSSRDCHWLACELLGAGTYCFRRFNQLDVSGDTREREHLGCIF